MSQKFGGLAVVTLAVALTTGCVSTKDIEALSAQMSGVQQQVLQLQKQSSSKDEVTTLASSISEQTSSLLRSEADVQVELQAVSEQIDQLRSNLEDTNYRLAQLSQQLAATNQELKSLRSLTIVSPNAAGSPPTPSSLPGASSEDPQTQYQGAYNSYLRGNYDLAILGFRQYLENFANTELADNATYWIGESYFNQEKYRQAIQEFDSMLQKYARSDKRASALLKKGYALLASGQQEQGIAQLRSVVSEHPSTDEANLAKQRLETVGQ